MQRKWSNRSARESALAHNRAKLIRSDPCDLNLDLFCTELLCECEAILERLPEGDEDDHFIFERSTAQDDPDADDGDDGE